MTRLISLGKSVKLKDGKIVRKPKFMDAAKKKKADRDHKAWTKKGKQK